MVMMSRRHAIRTGPIGGQRLGDRDRQEDAWAVGVGEATGPWAAVADGVGGHPDGDRASQEAVAAVTPYLTSPDLGLRPEEWERWLMAGMEAADIAVRRLSPAGFVGRPPATTLVMAVGFRDLLCLAHIGDSRAYLVRGAAVKPLTIDMTPAGDRVAKGDPWETQNTASDSNILRACLGMDPLTVDRISVAWRPGDVLVLTSDGLNSIPLTAWPGLIRQPDPIHAILDAHPWRDNATVALVPHPQSRLSRRP